MTNHFDIAREMCRLLDAGTKSAREICIEIIRRFPEATSADIDRARDIALERFDILEEMRQEAACAFAERWYSGPEAEEFFDGAPSKQVLENAAMFYLMDHPLKFTADTLFPKPDKTKS